MDDIELIEGLKRSLLLAASLNEWQKVEMVNRQITSLLASLRHQPLSEAKHEALKALQQAHRQVYEHCRDLREAVSKQLNRVVQNREGAVAYAAFTSAEDQR